MKLKPNLHLHPETLLSQAGLCTDETTGSISSPIYQTATFRHDGLGKSTGYDYSRTSNPTRTVLEQCMAELEKGSNAFAFSSGMAAIDALCRLFVPGDRIVLSRDIYGGTYRLFEKLLKPLGIESTYIDTSDLASVQNALKVRTTALFIETPGNPLMGITDIRAVAALAHKAGAFVIVDNTFMTPYLQKPLTLGADVVVHSGTKFLGGHNDLLAGIAVTLHKEVGLKIAYIQNATGAVLSPFDSWLLLRGLKTLSIRLEKSETNAHAIVSWLLKNKKVKAVYYPGLKSHPGHSIHKKQSAGGGAIISFRVKTPKLAYKILERVKVISFAESLGGVESLITHPAIQTHADMPEKFKTLTGVTNDLLRISVGIEYANDLIEDLDRALN